MRKQLSAWNKGRLLGQKPFHLPLTKPATSTRILAQAGKALGSYRAISRSATRPSKTLSARSLHLDDRDRSRYNTDMSNRVIPTTNLRAYITELARQHNVRYALTSDDAMANVITHLADDDVVMDDVEELILALERAGVIEKDDVVPMHVNYLREKFAVRPLQRF